MDKKDGKRNLSNSLAFGMCLGLVFSRRDADADGGEEQDAASDTDEWE